MKIIFNMMLIFIVLIVLTSCVETNNSSIKGEFNVVYHIDEENVEIQTFTNCKESSLLVPNKLGYTFNGWFNRRGIEIKKIYANKDYELWAKWEKLKPKFIHLSLDDVLISFNNLANKEYNNLFDEPLFKELKKLHDEYNAKFSLYTYNNVLEVVSDKYQKDFKESCEWLKIGFHSNYQGMNLSNSSYEDGVAYWNDFVLNVERICGSTLSIDRIPRLEYFYGSKEVLLGMRDAHFGAQGFLSSDDNRCSYYFNDETIEFLYYNDHIKDNNNQLTFVSTDIRLDWFYDFRTNNSYRKPTQDNVYEELIYRYNSDEFASAFKSIIVFTHEWLVYDGVGVNSKFNSIVETCKFAENYDVDFDYPQNICY